MSCHSSSSSNNRGKRHRRRWGQREHVRGRRLTIALAGNANVGKSVIFNHLTGSTQIIGNWPGKTVARAEGTLSFRDYDITVIDLPGIYSFSTFSQEELVSREYIASEKPDVVINVVDASVLERNLFFTLQLREMDVPLVVCLNQADLAERKGIRTDFKGLENGLGAPVVRTVAIRGEGLQQLVETAIAVAEKRVHGNAAPVRYGDEVEKRVVKLARLIEERRLDLGYSSRWVAVKLFEGDQEIKRLVGSKSPETIEVAGVLAGEISRFHKEPCYAVIAAERYSLASGIAAEVQSQSVGRVTFSEKLDWLATHKVLGYVVSGGVIMGLLLWTFLVGGFLSNVISGGLSAVEPLNPKVSGSILGILWNGIFGGIVAGITLVVPFVLPFYLMLAVIEDSGILTRIAFMMDSAMHKIGLHGKALIPLILGYGCNVPAIQACRIMETRRERLLAAFAITFAPCAARTIVILGLVAVFVSPVWALGLYAVDIALIFVLGRIALKVVPGKTTGLIMEMHPFKVPSLGVVTRQTWARTKSIIYVVFPIYIAGSALIQIMYATGVLHPLSGAMAFLTVTWLGLPAVAGILLILGVVRKEFIVLAAVAIFGSTNLALFLTPAQLITLALVGTVYIPCLSTIAVLAKEFGWKAASSITVANLAAAVLAGGLAFRILTLAL